MGSCLTISHTFFLSTYNPGPKIYNKIEKSSKTEQEKKCFDIYLCMFLDCYYQSLISGREIGHQTMSPHIFEIFLIFFYFLRSLVLSYLPTHEATCIPSLLYKVSFCLWLIRSVLKHCKVPKYYDQDCLKIFFLPSTLPMMIQISTKKCSFGSKKLVLSENYQ